MKVCPKCMLEYNDKFSFCQKCGGKLEVKQEKRLCSSCGEEIKTSGAFCPFCGASLLVSTVKDNTTKMSDPHNEKESKLNQKSPSSQNNNDKIEILNEKKPSNDSQSLSNTSDSLKNPKNNNRNSSSRDDEGMSFQTKMFLALLVFGVVFVWFILLSPKKSSVPTAIKTTSTETKNLSFPDEPDLSFPAFALIKNGVFKSESELKEKLITPIKINAYKVANALSKKSAKLFCVTAYENYKEPNKEYVISIIYILPDTLTYPQKDIMEYTTLSCISHFINNERIKNDPKGVWLIRRIQYNKQTNEKRELEFGTVYFKDDQPIIKFTQLPKETTEKWERVHHNSHLDIESDWYERNRYFHKNF